LNLKRDLLVSKFAFKCNLSHYTAAARDLGGKDIAQTMRAWGRLATYAGIFPDDATLTVVSEAITAMQGTSTELELHNMAIVEEAMTRIAAAAKWQQQQQQQRRRRRRRRRRQQQQRGEERDDGASVQPVPPRVAVRRGSSSSSPAPPAAAPVTGGEAQSQSKARAAVSGGGGGGGGGGIGGGGGEWDIFQFRKVQWIALLPAGKRATLEAALAAATSLEVELALVVASAEVGLYNSNAVYSS
jgi:hypothetical protein